MEAQGLCRTELTRHEIKEMWVRRHILTEWKHSASQMQSKLGFWDLGEGAGSSTYG